MKPGPCVLVTVTFNETAWAPGGMPHFPVRVKLRGTPPLSAGVPYPAGKPAWRVSTIRQGERPMKGRGLVTPPIVEIPPLALSGDHVAGAGQSAIFPTRTDGSGP